MERGGIGLSFTPKPIGSMYGIFAYIYHKNQPNVGKYTIHGSLGKWWVSVSLLLSYFFIGWALRKNSKIQEVMKGSQLFHCSKAVSILQASPNLQFTLAISLPGCQSPHHRSSENRWLRRTKTTMFSQK